VQVGAGVKNQRLVLRHADGRAVAATVSLCTLPVSGAEALFLAMTAGALNARELAAAAGMSEGEADHFLQACQLCGRLEERANVLAEVKPGLFDQLWQRWLK
jgi:hypothetical protein